MGESTSLCDSVRVTPFMTDARALVLGRWCDGLNCTPPHFYVEALTPMLRTGPDLEVGCLETVRLKKADGTAVLMGRGRRTQTQAGPCEDTGRRPATCQERGLGGKDSANT